MPIFSQGEDYVEEDTGAVQESEEQVEVEETEEPEPKQKPRISPPNAAQRKEMKKLNPKVIACAGVGAVVLVIAIFAAVKISSSMRVQAQQDALESQAEHDRQLAEMFPQESPAETQTAETVPEQQSLIYNDTELEALRKWGYTGYQIELASQQGLSARGLVDEARAQREEAQKEALAAVSDTASPEYQNLLNSTWLGGEPLDLSTVDPTGQYTVSRETVNVDFEKIEARGTQLYIKVYFDDGKSAFMQMNPRRYITLPNSGNIVVSVEKYEITETEYVFISISEVSISE